MHMFWINEAIFKISFYDHRNAIRYVIIAQYYLITVSPTISFFYKQL